MFEGILRQHNIAKGRSRDTAYFSMLDSEWPARKAAFERWLAPDNFDAQGNQKTQPRRAERRRGALDAADNPPAARAGVSLVSFTILTLLSAGFALTLIVFHPGYLTVDAWWVYKAISDGLGDWQSPVMSMLWRLIDPIAPGSLSMFLLMAAALLGELRPGRASRWRDMSAGSASRRRCSRSHRRPSFSWA